MYYTKQKTIVFRCDSEADMEDARTKACQDNPSFTVIKEKKDYKTKKSKGEIVDEFWLYAVTLDLMEE